MGGGPPVHDVNGETPRSFRAGALFFHESGWPIGHLGDAIALLYVLTARLSTPGSISSRDRG